MLSIVGPWVSCGGPLLEPAAHQFSSVAAAARSRREYIAHCILYINVPYLHIRFYNPYMMPMYSHCSLQVLHYGTTILRYGAINKFRRGWGRVKRAERAVSE